MKAKEKSYHLIDVFSFVVAIVLVSIPCSIVIATLVLVGYLFVGLWWVMVPYSYKCVFIAMVVIYGCFDVVLNIGKRQ